MNDYPHEQTGHECTNAEQPYPLGDGTKCYPYKDPCVPTIPPRDPCPPPDHCCGCPQKPGTTSNCLEQLIALQTAEIVGAESADAFKKVLVDLLNTAEAANQKYTPDVYKELVEAWVVQDKKIVDVIHTVVCKVPCWRCIIDCYICPLLYDFHGAQKSLYDDGKLYENVHDLYDVQYWHTRDKDAKERRFNRIKAVLAAWKDPVKTIQDALKTIDTAIAAVNDSIGKEPGKAVYDVFMLIVPLHLAIAPPQGSKWKTAIDQSFTGFCACDTPKPDNCCGPDVGDGSLLQQLIGPQPYLIAPEDYFKLICCLVEHRYEPAQKAAKKAATDLAIVQSQIASLEKQMNEGIKPIGEKARVAIPSLVNCDEYKPKPQPTQNS